MELSEVIKTRRTARTFLDKEVPLETIKKVINYGLHAPSGCNTQPWKFYVVTDTKTRDKLSKVHKYSSFINKAPVNIVACLDKSLTLFEPSDLISVALSVENILLGITDEGMRSCYVYVKDKSELENMVYVKEVLNIPENIEPIGIIAFGYSDEKITKKVVKGIDEVVTFV